jgi:preprotein translocase subunit SecF
VRITEKSFYLFLLVSMASEIFMFTRDSDYGIDFKRGTDMKKYP